MNLSNARPNSEKYYDMASKTRTVPPFASSPYLDWPDSLSELSPSMGCLLGEVPPVRATHRNWVFSPILSPEIIKNLEVRITTYIWDKWWWLFLGLQ